MMKKIFLILSFITIALSVHPKDAVIPSSSEPRNIKDIEKNPYEKTNKLLVTVFYSTHCKICMKLKKEFFPEIEERYKGKVIWEELNTSDNKQNLVKLMTLSIRLRGEDGRVPSVLIGNNLLVGASEIKNKLADSIEIALKNRGRPLSFMNIELLQVFKKISVFTVLLSGLIDGINPCAFAVIVFFVSFLAVYGYRKKAVVYVGIFYCLAVFLTYLLIGLGFFNVLYSVSNFYTIIKIFYYFIAGFCFFLSILALYDFFKFRRTKESEGLILQLPNFLKKRINEVIGLHLRKKKDEGLISLSVSAFIVGFFVSLLEGACTGQVYIPTIVLILKNTNLRIKAFSYLFLYNIMFIAPLVTIFLLSLFGFSSQKFNNFLKENMAAIKFLMFLLFLLLGFVILWIS